MFEYVVQAPLTQSRGQVVGSVNVGTGVVVGGMRDVVTIFVRVRVGDSSVRDIEADSL